MIVKSVDYLIIQAPPVCFREQMGLGSSDSYSKQSSTIEIIGLKEGEWKDHVVSLINLCNLAINIVSYDTEQAV